MERFEHHNGRVRINPLADWTANQIAWYFDTHDLPKHPLVAKNYLSIGCAPCTTKVVQGEATVQVVGGAKTAKNAAFILA